MILLVNSEGPEQTAWMRRLIWAFAVCICPKTFLHGAAQMMQYEPAHDKTYKMACAPSKDSDQPGHPPSLIRVVAVR